jgi:hypothetical protein
MKKILILFLTISLLCIAIKVYAFSTAIQAVLSSTGEVTYASLLGTSDGKWLVTSDGKVLKTVGTEKSHKILINADDEMLVTTTSGKILTTP